MNPHLPRLIELQALDLRMAEIKSQRRQIPQRLEAAERPLQAAREAQKTAAATVEAMTKERRASERELDAQEAQIEKMRGRTSEIKTNKEYQAHLFEIELASKKKGEIEERVLGLMEQIESVQRNLTEAHAKVEEAERAFIQGKKGIEELETRLVAESAELESRHRAATEGAGGPPRPLCKAEKPTQGTSLGRLAGGYLSRVPSSTAPAAGGRSQTFRRIADVRLLPSNSLLGGRVAGEASAATRSAHAQDDEAGESL